MDTSCPNFTFFALGLCIHVTPPPFSCLIASFFGEQTGRIKPPDLAAPDSVPRILYIINTGTHHTAATARLLIS